MTNNQMIILMTISIQKQPNTCNIGASDPVTIHITRVIESFNQFNDHTVQRDFTLVKAHYYTQQDVCLKYICCKTDHSDWSIQCHCGFPLYRIIYGIHNSWGAIEQLLVVLG